MEIFDRQEVNGRKYILIESGNTYRKDCAIDEKCAGYDDVFVCKQQPNGACFEGIDRIWKEET